MPRNYDPPQRARSTASNANVEKADGLRDQSPPKDPVPGSLEIHPTAFGRAPKIALVNCAGASFDAASPTRDRVTRSSSPMLVTIEHPAGYERARKALRQIRERNENAYLLLTPAAAADARCAIEAASLASCTILCEEALRRLVGMDDLVVRMYALRDRGIGPFVVATRESGLPAWSGVDWHFPPVIDLAPRRDPVDSRAIALVLLAARNANLSWHDRLQVAAVAHAVGPADRGTPLGLNELRRLAQLLPTIPFPGRLWRTHAPYATFHLPLALASSVVSALAGALTAAVW